MDRAKILKLYNLLFLSFVFVIPFEDYFNAIPNILLAILSFFSLFLITKEQLKTMLKSKTILVLIVLILFTFLLSFINSTGTQDAFFLSKVIIPLVVILLSAPIKNKQNIKYSFIAATLVAVLYSLFNVLTYISLSEEFDFMQGEFITEMLVSERIYIGFCAALSLIFSLDSFVKSNNKNVKILLIATSIIFTTFVFLIVARIALIAVVFILFAFVLSKLNLKKKIVVTAVLVLFISIFVLGNKNITDRFLHSHDVYRKGMVAKIKKHEPRAIIWSCAFDILKKEHHFIFGNGFAKTKEQLVECYEQVIEIDHKRNWFVSSRFNTHNQFLDFLISSGITGLSLFILLLFFLFKETEKDFFAIAVIGSLVLILLVDNILHRQIGGYLFGVLVFLLLENKFKSLKT